MACVEQRRSDHCAGVLVEDPDAMHHMGARWLTFYKL